MGICRRYALRLLAVLFATVGARAQEGVSPSFDCARATAPDERQICQDDRLAELDQAMTLGFGQALKNVVEYNRKLLGSAMSSKDQAALEKEYREEVRSNAKASLADRRACGTAVICILDAQISAISSFTNSGSNVPVPPWIGEYRQLYAKQHPEVMEPHLPKTVGHCTRTKIASITGRFGEVLKAPKPGGDEGSGTAVAYANDAHQVSYSYEEQVALSHIGDEVLLCLSSIPRNCPPGDDRGRVYSATNIKSGGSWIMPDSQHSCGGA